MRIKIKYRLGENKNDKQVKSTWKLGREEARLMHWKKAEGCKINKEDSDCDPHFLKGVA